MLGNALNGVIRFSLHQRVLVAAVAVFLTVYGGWQILQLPIDVFPNLDRPRVVVMTEAPGRLRKRLKRTGRLNLLEPLVAPCFRAAVLVEVEVERC